MDDVPGRVPGTDELALLAAAQRVVGEYFARLDRADVEGVLALYAENATLQGVKGKDAIRKSILKNSGAVAGRKTPHLPTNIRAVSFGDGVAVDYTVLAYLHEGPGPYPPTAILNQRQVLMRSGSDGSLQIVDHQVDGYDLSQPQ